jgi:hypothetical protein
MIMKPPTEKGLNIRPYMGTPPDGTIPKKGIKSTFFWHEREV